jgi:hypothetical protein
MKQKKKELRRQKQRPHRLPAGYKVEHIKLEWLEDLNRKIRLQAYLKYGKGKASSADIVALSGLLDAGIMPLLCRKRFENNESTKEALALLDSAQKVVYDVVARAEKLQRYIFKGDELQLVLDALEVANEVCEITRRNFELSEWYDEMGAIQCGAESRGIENYYVTVNEIPGAGQIKRYFQTRNRQVPYFLGGLKFPPTYSDTEEINADLERQNNQAQ